MKIAMPYICRHDDGITTAIFCIRFVFVDRLSIVKHNNHHSRRRPFMIHDINDIDIITS